MADITTERSSPATRTASPRDHSKRATVLALFTSTGALICCALPIAVVTIAGGAAMASLVSAFPWLVTISFYKGWIFLGSGVIIFLTGILVYRPRGKVACTIAGGEGCKVAGRFTKSLFWMSVGIYLCGAFFAYGLVPVLHLFEHLV